MKNKKRWLLIGVAILIAGLLIGSKVYMDKQQEAKVRKEKMIEIVKSEEAKKVFEEGLKNLDSKALTSEGVIQNYKIDHGSIEQNQMGEIMVDLIINHDSKLKVYNSLNKSQPSGRLKNSGGGNSFELEELLELRQGD
ncbi:DUF1310 family protein [Listeria welshimeri]|uniref:DUF1310 family protein n=1 Tax=Listeria welshimeri TaxID=1643 RepID=UPI0016276B0A|nr:DUF1310 family protein [Listeria welshimeri]MBC1478088.1 DUF1310 family protein [Listeria welshimeri]MBC2010713.1 DUF1310 family protein [Listeria welshimeri]MBC2040815.1 DUF1310 family protein [Listeria welshimeri]MBF2461978.1 DUF1310 family protein [Listeria welshimeri]MBF2531425.1 DUF1310 family protein [Listeria welshimeri]